LWCLKQNKQMKCPSKMVLYNLFVCHLFFTLSTPGRMVLSSISNFCHFARYAAAIIGYGTFFAAVLISADRAVPIRFPYRYAHAKRRHVFLILAMKWLLTICLSVATFAGSSDEHHDCVERPIIFSNGYAIPIAVSTLSAAAICVMSGYVIRKVLHHRRAIQIDLSVLPQEERRKIEPFLKKQNQTTYTLGFILLANLVNMLPSIFIFFAMMDSAQNWSFVLLGMGFSCILRMVDSLIFICRSPVLTDLLEKWLERRHGHVEALSTVNLHTANVTGSQQSICILPM